MKKKIFLRLCLIMIALLSFHSCRQDLLPDKETYNNSSAFQLTSKRISLNEAKHKAKLLPELGKVDAEFKAKTKNSAFGKTVNYGNGVSIDTDDVIYIENGPNYYTYTFRINRENAPADAPVENLVLSPLSDGTYRELLVYYNLTSQEKQQLENGLFVDLTGKVISQELASGTYGLNLMGKTTSTQCNWVSATVNVKCPCEGHTLGQECTCPKGKPKQYVITWNVCEDIEDSTPAAGSPASGGGGGTGTPTPPCDENGIPTQPQNPDSTLGNQPCNNGTVTLPNLPNLGDDPCKKTKASTTAANNILKNPDVQTQMDAVLKGKRTLENEWNTAIGLNNDGSYDITPAIEQQQNSGSSPSDLLSNPSSFFADGHTHSGDPGKPSAGDLYGMLNEVFYNANFKYRYVYGDSDMGTPEVYALVLNDKTVAIQFRTAYLKSENYDPVKHGFLKGSPLWKEFETIRTLYTKTSTVNTSGEDYHPKAVAMAYILENLNAGISLAKVDNNGDLKKINVILEEITNPDGTKGQRVKVSKCP